MSHNSDRPAPGLEPERDGKNLLPFRLTGAQKKTAFALRQNAEDMIREAGLNSIAFLTLTVGDEIPDQDAPRGHRFEQVWDSKEASRRINNLNRRVLPGLFDRAIVVTERHKNGAIHFHILGSLRSRADIRSGFDFVAFEAACKARNRKTVNLGAEITYKMAATEALRELWSTLRLTLPRYGFGRAELTPVRKTGKAIAAYVSKYIEKNLFSRRAEDKGKKLVRYIGDGWKVKDAAGFATRQSIHIKPNMFSWASQRACAWRVRAREMAELAHVETREQMADAFGPRWAFHISRIQSALPVWQPGKRLNIEWGTWAEKERVRYELAKASKGWCQRRQKWLEQNAENFRQEPASDMDCPTQSLTA